MRHFFYLTVITLAICVLSPHPLRAQNEGVLKNFEPLRLLFVDPENAEFFFDFSAGTTDSFHKGRGIHRLGYGGGISFSWAAFQKQGMRFRPAFDVVVMRSANGGVNKNINALDLTSSFILYLDNKISFFTTFLGVGGGYYYLLDEVTGAKKIKDKGGGAVLIGDVGVSFKFIESSPWSVFFGYRYIHGLTKRKFDTREKKLDVSTHNFRIGVRVNF